MATTSSVEDEVEVVRVVRNSLGVASSALGARVGEVTSSHKSHLLVTVWGVFPTSTTIRHTPDTAQQPHTVRRGVVSVVGGYGKG